MSEAGTEGSWVQIHISGRRAERAEQLAQQILAAPFQRRSWAELGYFILSSVLAGGAAVALAAIGLVGVGSTVIVVGFVILAGGLRAARGLGRWQRGLAWRVLGEQIGAPDPFRRRPGFLGWLRAAFGDSAAWRAVAYFAVKLPLSAFGTWFAFSVWLEALLGIVSPLAGSQDGDRFGLFGRLGGGLSGRGPLSIGGRLAIFVSGIFLLFVAPWAMRAVISLDRFLMQLLLGPDASASRVRTLEESRSKTLDAATETLRRIERDLHDGTQAQLVALAMRLGQAKEKLAALRADLSADLNADHPAGSPTAPGTGELGDIQRLIDDAHRGAKEAITDLRDLARGIHPPALDTGLENALATLAARSPVPTELTLNLTGRPSPAIETISYFCAAELLANVAQHAHASRAVLTCAQHGPWLRLVVRDDGRGGAEINRVGSASSGLAGLADRVGAADGNLSIASPVGGPTVITVDLLSTP